MKKGLLVLAGLLPLLSAFGVERHFLEEARSAGVDWAHLDRGTDGWVFQRVRFRGIEASEARVPLAWPLQVRVEGVDLDLAGWSGSAGGNTGSGGTTLDVQLSDVGLRWGDRVLVSGLTGQWDSEGLSLLGEGFSLNRGAGKTVVRMEMASPFPEAAGLLRLSLELENAQGVLELESSTLAVKHSLLAKQPVELQDVSAKVHLDLARDTFAGVLKVGRVQLELLGRFAEGVVDFRLELPRTPVEDVLAPLRSVVPEMESAHLVGSALGWMEGSWPAGSWKGDADLQGFGVEGAVPRLQDLKYGPFDYRIRGEDGSWGLRTSGEGTEGWTPYRAIAPVLSDAVVAAEDSAFLVHSGYDMESMREAMAANLAKGQVVRGGSTLTQQLAKNLFLDGERTVVRKVRELLLAAEMDRALGKTRVMELYLNVVEWGPDFHGVKAASERYFMRSPAGLQPHEAAFLAAILPAPRTFYQKWYLRDRAGEYRIDWVLGNMVDGKSLSPKEGDAWSRAPLRFVPPPVPKE
jgi:hypothetical protein